MRKSRLCAFITGYERDTETDLDFSQARMYANRLGRFTSVDPLRANAPLKDPQMFNRFGYVRNSPTTFIDSLGLSPEKPGLVLDGGDCARRRGRCIKGGLVPEAVTLNGDVGTDTNAVILLPTGLVSQLERNAQLFGQLAIAVGKKLGNALERVAKIREMTNAAFDNPLQTFSGINTGDFLPYVELSDGTFVVGPEISIADSFGGVGYEKTITGTASLAGVFDDYNAARSRLNEQYDDAKVAFVALWSDVVVPVQHSDLGYTRAVLTADYLEGLFDAKVGTKFFLGIEEGRSKQRGPRVVRGGF